jgi:hypothetical protein
MAPDEPRGPLTPSVLCLFGLLAILLAVTVAWGVASGQVTKVEISRDPEATKTRPIEVQEAGLVRELIWDAERRDPKAFEAFKAKHTDWLEVINFIVPAGTKIVDDRGALRVVVRGANQAARSPDRVQIFRGGKWWTFTLKHYDDRADVRAGDEAWTIKGEHWAKDPNRQTLFFRDDPYFVSDDDPESFFNFMDRANDQEPPSERIRRAEPEVKAGLRLRPRIHHSLIADIDSGICSDPERHIEEAVGELVGRKASLGDGGKP